MEERNINKVHVPSFVYGIEQAVATEHVCTVYDAGEKLEAITQPDGAPDQALIIFGMVAQSRNPHVRALAANSMAALIDIEGKRDTLVASGATLWSKLYHDQNPVVGETARKALETYDADGLGKHTLRIYQAFAERAPQLSEEDMAA